MSSYKPRVAGSSVTQYPAEDAFARSRLSVRLHGFHMLIALDLFSQVTVMKRAVHRPGVRMECDSVSNKRGLIEPRLTSGAPAVRFTAAAG